VREGSRERVPQNRLCATGSIKPPDHSHAATCSMAVKGRQLVTKPAPRDVKLSLDKKNMHDPSSELLAGEAGTHRGHGFLHECRAEEAAPATGSARLLPETGSGTTPAVRVPGHAVAFIDVVIADSSAPEAS